MAGGEDAGQVARSPNNRVPSSGVGRAHASNPASSVHVARVACTGQAVAGPSAARAYRAVHSARHVHGGHDVHGGDHSYRGDHVPCANPGSARFVTVLVRPRPEARPIPPLWP